MPQCAQLGHHSHQRRILALDPHLLTDFYLLTPEVEELLNFIMLWELRR